MERSIEVHSQAEFLDALQQPELGTRIVLATDLDLREVPTPR
jgi:hypothetical protein